MERVLVVEFSDGAAPPARVEVSRGTLAKQVGDSIRVVLTLVPTVPSSGRVRAWTATGAVLAEHEYGPIAEGWTQIGVPPDPAVLQLCAGAPTAIKTRRPRERRGPAAKKPPAEVPPTKYESRLTKLVLTLDAAATGYTAAGGQLRLEPRTEADSIMLL